MAATSAKLVPSSHGIYQKKVNFRQKKMAVRGVNGRSTDTKMFMALTFGSDDLSDPFDGLPSDCNPDIQYTESKFRIAALG